MILTKAEIVELEAAAKPLVDFLNKYGHPHATAIVSSTRCEVVEGVAAVPFPPQD